jgi:hypothetical protein
LTTWKDYLRGSALLTPLSVEGRTTGGKVGGGGIGPCGDESAL